MSKSAIECMMDMGSAVNQLVRAFETFRDGQAEPEPTVRCFESADVLIKCVDGMQVENWCKHTWTERDILPNNAIAYTLSNCLHFHEITEADFIGALRHVKEPQPEPMCDIHEVEPVADSADEHGAPNCDTCKYEALRVDEAPCSVCSTVMNLWTPPEPSHATPAEIPERFAVHVQPENMPVTSRQRLWHHLECEHGLVLVDSELEDIINRAKACANIEATQ